MNALPVPSLHGRAAAAGALVVACAAWAAWPLRSEKIEAPVLEAPVATPRQREVPSPLDTGAFRAPLWVAQPPPPPAPQPAPPPPPLRLQLVAIVQEGDAYKAALYDPDQDRLLIVGAGESVAGRTIEQVASGAVTIRDQNLSRTLSLRTEEAPR